MVRREEVVCDKVGAVNILKAGSYNVTDACRALGISRSGYYYRIKAIKDEHLF